MLKPVQKSSQILESRKNTDLEIESAIDFQKFNLYSLVHHSTTIEGSTLTEGETQLLLDKGLTAQGKPLENSLM